MEKIIYSKRSGQFKWLQRSIRQFIKDGKLEIVRTATDRVRIKEKIT